MAEQHRLLQFQTQGKKMFTSLKIKTGWLSCLSSLGKNKQTHNTQNCLASHKVIPKYTNTENWELWAAYGTLKRTSLRKILHGNQNERKSALMRWPIIGKSVNISCSSSHNSTKPLLLEVRNEGRLIAEITDDEKGGELMVCQGYTQYIARKVGGQKFRATEDRRSMAKPASVESDQVCAWQSWTVQRSHPWHLAGAL